MWSMQKLSYIYMGKPEYQFAWGYAHSLPIYRRDFAWSTQNPSYIYMGKPEYQFAWGYTQSLLKYIGGF